MSVLKKCPFQINLTSTGSEEDCSSEVSPFKDLDEVVVFYNELSKGVKQTWIDDVLEIQPATEFCYYTIEDEVDEEGWFPKPRIERSSVPKTLFCHDYKGGYLEDRFVNGSFKSDSYIFFNWTCVDIFVYFSHHFVTIPPPSWINAAHTHGVPILGTLITEGKTGEVKWTKILESEEKALWFAEALALVAETYKFDGYLLNVENSLEVKMMPLLMMFIKSLKQYLGKYKKFKTYVIWYDSLTVYGELKWQNELNYNNKPFFDLTDGIFLNYSWKKRNLESSRKMAAERIHDVFVGVDVFGRNMFGGGGYETKVALDVVKEKNLSTALFAFGWTEEKVPGNFAINDEIFWGLIVPYFYTHGTRQFPFKSDFNRGCGLRFYKNGMVVDDQPWFNLSRQSYHYSYLKSKNKNNKQVYSDIISKAKEYLYLLNQKTDLSTEREKAERLVFLVSELNILYQNLKESLIEYTFHDAFNGGGCIRVNPSIENGTKHVPLFDCDIEIKDDWYVKTVMKSERERHQSEVELYPIVYLVVRAKDGGLIKIELRHGEEQSSEAGWVIRKFMLTQRGNILEIGLLVNPSHRPVLFGEIVVSDR